MRVVAGLIAQDEKILLARRLLNKSFAGYWEIPGGKVEENESDEDAIQRELSEELGIEVTDFNKVCEYTVNDIDAVIFNIQSWQRVAYGKEGQTIHWYRKDELENVLLTPLTHEAMYNK